MKLTVKRRQRPSEADKDARALQTVRGRRQCLNPELLLYWQRNEAGMISA